VVLPHSSLDWAIPKGFVTRRDACRAVPYDDRLVRLGLSDIGLAEVLNTALAQDDVHRPATAGVTYDVAQTDQLHGNLPPRAVNVKPEKFTPRHDVLLTRALAVSAGLPAKTYQPVQGSLTDVFVRSLAQERFLIPANAWKWEGGRSVYDVYPRSFEQFLVNINTASSEELQTLPGIGPKTAEKIIQYRQANGPFEKIEDIMNVKGIAQGKFAKIKDKITVAP
jgi:comEA protein